jgi:hypothetical protein
MASDNGFVFFAPDGRAPGTRTVDYDAAVASVRSYYGPAASGSYEKRDLMRAAVVSALSARVS